MKHTLDFFALQSNLSLISLKGEDVCSFLQGQITNDINLVTEKNSIYAGFCNPKGRLLGFFHIIKFNNTYYLICPKDISESILKKLSMYILRANIRISLVKEIQLIGVIFNKKNNINNLLMNFPITHLQSSICENVHITKIAGDNYRFIIIGEDEFIDQFIQKNKIQLSQGLYETWKSQDIAHKIPNIYKETQQEFIPQSLNLDLIEAINFKKGCYTGQEIVARTHYLGKIKRRMYQGTCKSKDNIIYGDEVLSNKEQVGRIIDFSSTNFEYNLLLELRVDAINQPLTVKNNIIHLPTEIHSLH